MWRGFAQVPRSACLWRHRPPYPWPRAAPLLCSPVPWWLHHWPELGWPLQWGGELKWLVREILMWEDGRGFHSKCSGVSELLHKRYIDTSVGRKRSSPSVSWTHKMLDVSRHLSCKLCSGGRMSQKQHTLHTSACSYDRVTSISRHNKCGVTKLCGRSHVLYRLWHCSLVHLINAQTNCAYLVRTLVNEPKLLVMGEWVQASALVHS